MVTLFTLRSVGVTEGIAHGPTMCPSSGSAGIPTFAHLGQPGASAGQAKLPDVITALQLSGDGSPWQPLQHTVVRLYMFIYVYIYIYIYIYMYI